MTTMLTGKPQEDVLTQAEPAEKPQDGQVAEPVLSPEDIRLKGLGVDLSKYQYIEDRDTFRPVISKTNRSVYLPMVRSMSARLFKQVPDPMMLTHIVTTRCNYSCHFCSFADTLNNRSNELSLEEIEQAYMTIGQNLNVIVYSGGETTVNKNLTEIIEAAYRVTPIKSVYIISNAWKPDLIFQITHKIMQRCPGLHLTWSLSIEGPKHFNNTQRYTKSENWDAWQNTIDTAEGLKRMREKFGYHELDVQLCTVCTPDNHHLLDEWYTMVRDEIKPDKWNLNLMRRSVQMTDSGLETFANRRANNKLEDFEEKYLRITGRVREDVLSGKLKFLYHTKHQMDGALKSAVDLVSQEANRNTVLEKDQSFCCLAGQTGAYIGSDGGVSGCEEFANNPGDNNKSYGNLRDVNYDFQALWRSKKADELREKVGQSEECVGCTLESQRNYPSILVSFKSLVESAKLARQIK